MSSDLEYLKNYRPETLYIIPGKAGAYARLVSENELPIAELEVTSRSRLAVSAFFESRSGEYGTFKITKLTFNRRWGWREESHISITHFDAARMKAFVSILASLDLHDIEKARISLPDIDIQALGTLLESSLGGNFIRELSASPELRKDVYAIAAKRRVLAEFAAKLEDDPAEAEWQSFFEANPWIFGHGLNYVFLEKVAEKLEVPTTGATFAQAGKRTDALLHTRAEVSQYVLVEIKRSGSDLLHTNEYRSGCWAVSHELSDAVTQVQKTVFEFSRNRFRDPLRDMEGYDCGGDVYAIMPRSYLVIGNLNGLAGHDDKITCFELYRRHVRAPEILTFDELYERAKCIVENLGRD